jgi:hypothetical protein
VLNPNSGNPPQPLFANQFDEMYAEFSPDGRWIAYASNESGRRQTLKQNGSAIIANFALDGPTRCSGLPVVRYAPETLARELGDGFTLVDSAHHVHVTPWGTEQPFQYSRLVRVH